jgi:hypothetical protein
MSVRYDSLVLVIFSAEQLQEFQRRYHASGATTLFEIAREMKAEATDVINNFDFLEFADMLMRQTDPHLAPAARHHEDDHLLQRL